MTTYKDAGVNIDAGEETIDRIKPLVRQTFTPGVLTDIGAFGGFFELDTETYRQPVLVSSIDGVGTKLKVAISTGNYETIGEDLVNHCVNDIAVCGAVPLFFLDYYATGKLEPEIAEKVIGGFAKACRENGCALIGGETAEMPDVYRDQDFDLAGSIVGIVEKSRLLNGENVSRGDVLVGLPSTGLHTNGYTLARRVLFEHFVVMDRPPLLKGQSIGEALLNIHRSYLKPIQLLFSRDMAVGFAHITGGGITGNTRRVVRSPLQPEIDWQSWKRPAIFDLIADKGHVPEEDMRRTFNLGIGLVIIVPEARVNKVFDLLKMIDEEPVAIGRVI